MTTEPPNGMTHTFTATNAPPPMQVQAPSAQPQGELLDFTSPVPETIIRFKHPEDSRPLRDADGSIIYEHIVGDDGAPALDEFQRPILRLDSAGQPIPVVTPQPDPSTQREIWIRHVPLLYGIRQRAVAAAIKANQRTSREKGIDLQTLVSNCVNGMVKASNIRGLPGPAFDNLTDHALGDRIVRELRVYEQLNAMGAIDSGKGLPPASRP